MRLQRVTSSLSHAVNTAILKHLNPWCYFNEPFINMPMSQLIWSLSGRNNESIFCSRNKTVKWIYNDKHRSISVVIRQKMGCYFQTEIHPMTISKSSVDVIHLRHMIFLSCGNQTESQYISHQERRGCVSSLCFFFVTGQKVIKMSLRLKSKHILAWTISWKSMQKAGKCMNTKQSTGTS